MPKRILQGTVISDKGDKTVVVNVERRFTDPVMKKTVRKSKRYHAHDASNEVKVGDMVEIRMPPDFKLKSWEVFPALLSKGSYYDSDANQSGCCR